jgi:hypothetical protein
MVKIFFLFLILGFVFYLPSAFSAFEEWAAVQKEQPVIRKHADLTRENNQESEYVKYTSPGGSFAVMIPGKWEKKEKGHPYGDLTKIYGVRIIGPKNKNNVPVTMSVLYYSGEGIFPTYREYIINQLNSMVRIDYDREATIEDIKIIGRSAKRFQLRKFELVYLPMRNSPPMDGNIRYELAPPSIKVNMIQRYLVIPLQKGYYVLSYYAPEDTADTYQRQFEKVVASFEPHLP